MVQAQSEQRVARTAGSPKGWIFLLLAGAVVAYAMVERSPVGSIEWGDNLATARLAAQQGEGRAVLVAFTGVGCPYCRKMEREVLVRPEVERELRKFIPVRIDWREDQALSVRYRVEAIPTYVILDASGRSAGRLVGYHPVDQFISFLQRGGVVAASAAARGAPDR